KLTVKDQKLEGTLHVDPVESADGITAEILDAFVQSEGVNPSFIDQDALNTLAHLICADPKSAHEACVARGTPPTPGSDASIQLEDSIQTRLDEIESRQTKLDDATSNGSSAPTGTDDPDADNSIDFYEMSPFLIVEQGDRICTLIQATNGQDGTDIYGHNIASKHGKSSISLNDASVQVQIDGSVTAMCSGLLVILPTGVQVTETLEIPHDVDFSTANIDFPGDVIIDGGVLDNFCVRASGTVLIRKLVQSSSIEANGDITLDQGMAGKDKGSIIAHADLHAGYLESINATVGGDCTVEHEITNTTLAVSGQLNAPSASLRGGELAVANHCELNIVGSVQGVETTLILGSLRHVENLIERSIVFVEKAAGELDTKRNAHEQFVQSIGKPTPAQIEEQMGMEFEISELQSKLVKLEAATQQLMETRLTRATPSLCVHRVIFAKSVVYLPRYKVVFSQDLEGETTIGVDADANPTLTHHGKARPIRDVATVYPDSRVPLIEHRNGVFRIAA
ncbi:MAG: DUF342 domain-containing protein, partial [Phycisphaerales bacterium]|nr:DUF342 domain-containing protein [Phycisphaerales bacterium]